MTGHCCNNVHLSMDDTFIQWDEILGDPSKSTSLNDFVDSKIKGIGDDLGKLLDDKINAATDKIKEDLEKEVEAIALDIDPYKIKYKETTVEFTTSELGIFSVLLERKINFPYKSWLLRCIRKENQLVAILDLETPRAKFVFELGVSDQEPENPETVTQKKPVKAYVKLIDNKEELNKKRSFV